MSHRLNITWNSTALLSPAQLLALSYAPERLLRGPGSLVPPGTPDVGADSLADRARRSRERNWEALKRLADY